MLQNKSNKIKFWKIGTGFLNYYKVILYWLGNQDFLDMKNNKSNYKILIEKETDSNNLKNKTNRLNAFFEGNKKIKLYYVEESKNNDIKEDEDTENIYNNGTLSQFINFLEFFDIYKNNGSCLNMKENFVDNVITKVSKDNSNVKNILSNYIYNVLISKINVLISKIEKKINSINNVDLDIKEYDHELTGKDNQIIDSITIDIAKNKFEPGSTYYDTNFNHFGIIEKGEKIKKQKDNNENIKKSNFYFPLIKEIEDNITNKKDFNDLISIVKKYIEVLSLKNHWYLECVPILDFKTKKISDENKVKIFEDEVKKSEKSNKTQNQNLGKSEIGNSFLTNMYTLLIKRTNANNKLFLPIFQRDYVWNESIVSNFLLSLFDDIKNKKKSYLNNIIFVNKDHLNSDSITEIYCNIIDGQQRIFTTWLILLCLYKIYAYRNNKKIEELYKYFDDSDTIKDIFIKDTNNNQNSSENIESYANFYNILDFNEGYNGENNNMWHLLLSIVWNILKFEKEQKEQNKDSKDLDWIIEITKQILFNTYVTQTHLEKENFIEHKVFRNLNQNVKALNALDLLKNEIYDLCHLDTSISDIDSIDTKRSRIKEIINLYMEYIKPFYNDKNLIKNKDLETFARVLYEREKNNNEEIEIDNFDSNMSVFLQLQYCIKKWFKEKNKSIKETLDTFNKNINKYLLFSLPVTDYKINNFNFKFNGLLCQIYGVTLGGSLTVTYPIIWSLLDKFKIWDIVNNNSNTIKDSDLNNNIKPVSEWLYELERFIIVWKICYFKGDSLTNKFFEISKDIINSDDKKNKYSIEDFRNKLLKIKNLNNIQQINDDFREELKKILISKVKEDVDDLTNKMKTLFLIRINFYLRNKFSLIIKAANCKTLETYNDSDISYEHVLATTQKNSLKALVNKDDYSKNTKFLGNGTLLKKSQNSKTNNDEIWKKLEYYNDGTFLSNKIVDGELTKIKKNEKIEEMLNPLYTDEITKLINERDNMENKKPEKNIIDKEKQIYDEFVKNIEKRTEQMIDILCEMYKYDVNSKSQDEKNTNK